MAEIQPRMAVGYHFFNDFDTAPVVQADIRKYYDGPLALAADYMVFNVTADDIRVRRARALLGRRAGNLTIGSAHEGAPDEHASPPRSGSGPRAARRGGAARHA